MWESKNRLTRSQVTACVSAFLLIKKKKDRYLTKHVFQTISLHLLIYSSIQQDVLRAACLDTTRPNVL